MSASGPEISADWSRRTERLGLLRFGSPGAEKPGVVVPPADDRDELGPLRPGAVVLDVSSWISAYDEAFFGGGGVVRDNKVLIDIPVSSEISRKLRSSISFWMKIAR